MAARMYSPGPSTEELELLGLKIEDVEDTSKQEVWAENWTAFLIFRRLGTQWRTGMNRRTGLDFSLVTNPGGLFDLMDVRKKDRLELLDALHVMEVEALNQMAPEK